MLFRLFVCIICSMQLECSWINLYTHPCTFCILKFKRFSKVIENLLILTERKSKGPQNVLLTIDVSGVFAMPKINIGFRHIMFPLLFPEMIQPKFVLLV